jgi:MFS family permease
VRFSFVPALRFAREHPAFVRYQLGRFFAVTAWNVLSTALHWLVFERTHDLLQSGLVGLAQFAPLLLMALVGGAVADSFDRRKIVATCHAVLVLTALLFTWAASRPVFSMVPVYFALMLLGVIRAFTGPASQAIIPSLVGKEHFSRAVAFGSVVLNLATLIGPSLGGLAYGVFHARGHAEDTFTLCAAVFFVAFCLLARIPQVVGDAPAMLQPDAASVRKSGPGAVADGLRYVWSNKPVLGAISLDLFAVLLGGAVALLPYFASDVLHAGPIEFGFLRSAPAVGAVAMALVLTFLPLQKNAGYIMFFSVLVFGLATIAFGYSTSAPLSIFALFVVGASDMVSVQVRHTLVQLRTPDAMRGRVSAVNLVFITASNELGEFESGVTARFFGAVPAVVLGGIGTCLVVAIWMTLFPSLRKFENLDLAGRT